jgi:transposase
MGVKGSRKYTNDFKHRAVALAKEIGGAEAARKLGISGSNVYQWQNKLSSLGRVSLSDTKSSNESPEDELKRLRKENSDLKKANLILKSAAAFFSQDHLK